MVMRSAVAALVVLSATVAPALAEAGGFNYGFAEVTYFNSTDGSKYLDSNDIDSYGIAVKGSFPVHDYVHLSAAVSRGRLDDDGTLGDSPDVTDFVFAIGGNYDVHKQVSLFLDLGYYDVKFNGDNTTAYDGGYMVDTGIRLAFGKPFEVDLGLQRRGGDIDGNFYRVQALYRLSKRVSGTVGFLTGDGADPKEYSAGLRFYF